VSPEQLAVLWTAYVAKAEEWEVLLGDPEVPLRVLGQLRWRLSTGEFTGSGVDGIEAWRLLWLDAVTQVMTRRIGFDIWVDTLLPAAPDDPSSLGAVS